MPTASAYPSFEVPNTDLWGLLFERKDRAFPDDKVIYLDPSTSRSYTYAQVKQTALDFGTGLRALWDWQKGDVLALYTPNCIDTPAITWGTHWAGGLRDAGAKALVTQMPFLANARKAAKLVGLDESRIVVMGDERDKEGRVKHFSSIRNTSGATRYRKRKMNPAEDLAFLVYSSGTTGHPKGVMLTHRNIVSNVLMIKAGEGGKLGWNNGADGSGDRVLAFLPFFHIYGLTCLIHQSLYTGFTLVVMRKFDIESFCRIIQDHRITFAYVVPPVVLLLSKHPILVEALYARLKIPVKQGYGLSETSPTTHTQPWESWDKTIGSVGTLLPNQVAKYMDAEEKEVPAGQTGELWIKGPNVFKGYLNNEAMTKNALTEDGYFRTGDVGFQDKDGNFYIMDRVKELIKYKGFQVPPAELEGLLLSHPSIEDVAVVGVYDKAQATEVPRAYVVLAKGVEGSKKTEEEIVAWVRGKVAGHKRLRGGVRFVNEIPKSVSGKILRRVLKMRVKEEEENAGVAAGEKAKL
ncbi:hypothetical protein H2199_003328 [Coniosporium tulheliwenetii]|uniref:Uncharacterized protein n=1 Tax=Coniosporium tulheliwenetii TaxID=3383036 RepID=A0ACC2ZBZ9_9PEZI|nr:hypothetical protein H2199_003328 [Cladosporium sp. JES 115]